MSLSEAARAAREKADRSIDPCDHLVANALEGVVAAESRVAGVGEVDPADYVGADTFPRWSDVCPEGEHESYGEFMGFDPPPGTAGI